MKFDTWGRLHSHRSGTRKDVDVAALTGQLDGELDRHPHAAADPAMTQ
jgi:hypothetical protein